MVAVAHVNGHRFNGHRKSEDPEQLAFNLDVEQKPKPCSLRLGNSSWCYLPDGHEGDHEGVPPMYGPIEERPALWRRHRGKI